MSDEEDVPIQLDMEGDNDDNHDNSDVENNEENNNNETHEISRIEYMARHNIMSIGAAPKKSKFLKGSKKRSAFGKKSSSKFGKKKLSSKSTTSSTSSLQKEEEKREPSITSLDTNDKPRNAITSISPIGSLDSGNSLDSGFQSSLQPLETNPKTSITPIGKVGGSSMKKKLQSMEAIVSQMSEQVMQLTNHANHEDNEMHRLEEDTRRLLQETSEKWSSELKHFRDDMDHKLTLQAAENKRLQAHVATLKNENQTLHHNILILEQRLNAIEVEIMGEEEYEEEEEEG